MLRETHREESRYTCTAEPNRQQENVMARIEHGTTRENAAQRSAGDGRQLRCGFEESA